MIQKIPLAPFSSCDPFAGQIALKKIRYNRINGCTFGIPVMERKLHEKSKHIVYFSVAFYSERFRFDRLPVARLGLRTYANDVWNKY